VPEGLRLPAERPQGPDELVGDVGEGDAGAGERRQVGEAAAVDEARGDAAMLHQRGDLRAAAVDEDQRAAIGGGERIGQEREGVAAELGHQRAAHVVYSALSST